MATVDVMSRRFHKLWLKVAAVLIAGFGPVFFLGTMESTSEVVRWPLDMLSWPVDGQQTYEDPTTRFLTALTGGFLFGWGVMIWCLSGAAYDAAPEAIRKSFVVAAVSWFLLDSAGSITSGNGSNAAFNVIVLLLIIGPLWRPGRA